MVTFYVCPVVHARQIYNYIIPSTRNEILTGCLVNSGCCSPSAADKEQYSLESPFNTVSVQQRQNCMQRKCILISISFLLDISILFYSTSCCTLCGTDMQCFMSLHPSHRRISCRDIAGVSIEDEEWYSPKRPASTRAV